MNAEAPRGRFHSFRVKIAAALTLTALLSVVIMAVIGVRLIRQAEESVALEGLRRQADSLTGEAALVAGPAQVDASAPAQGTQPQPGSDLPIRCPGPAGPGRRGPQRGAQRGRRAGAWPPGETIEGRRETGPATSCWWPSRSEPAPASGCWWSAGRPASTEASLPIGSRILLAAWERGQRRLSIALFLSNRVAAPLRELASAARDIARGDFSRRVPVHSDDEIGVVAESFNSMAAALGAADSGQRDFFLSISHELRTPLTAIQGYAEAIEDGTARGDRLTSAAGVIVGESKRLTRLVSDLLDLARIDAKRFQVSIEPVEVEAVLRAVQQQLRPQGGGGERVDCGGERGRDGPGGPGPLGAGAVEPGRERPALHAGAGHNHALIDGGRRDSPAAGRRHRSRV